MVGIPTHSGTLTSATTDCLLQIQRAQLARGGEFEIEFYSGPVIADLRNAMAADFLGRDADALLMLDSDTGATGSVAMRLIDSGHPLVGCMYPKRLFDFESLSSKTGDLSTMMTQALQFVGKLETRTPGQVDFTVENGFARAIHVGTGLMLIRREVFERMIVAFPELKGTGFSPEAFGGPRFRHNWGFFNPAPVAGGGPNLAEDFSFCARWRAAGGEVWADVESRITHVGSYRFAGSFLEYLHAHGLVQAQPPVTT